MIIILQFWYLLFLPNPQIAQGNLSSDGNYKYSKKILIKIKD